MLFSYCRPLSVLPVFSKVIEILMYNRLIGFINDNDMLFEYQFGFQKGKSTYMALVILLDKISEALENGECVVGVFIHFSRPSIRLIMIFYWWKWNHKVLKTLLETGLKVIFVAEYSMLPIILCNQLKMP